MGDSVKLRMCCESIIQFGVVYFTENYNEMRKKEPPPGWDGTTNPSVNSRTRYPIAARKPPIDSHLWINTLIKIFTWSKERKKKKKTVNLGLLWKLRMRGKNIIRFNQNITYIYYWRSVFDCTRDNGAKQKEKKKDAPGWARTTNLSVNSRTR